MMPRSSKFPFFAVMEQTTPEGSKAEIIEEVKGANGDIKYLRFRQCLQSFGHRNRNKRLWKRWHIEKSLENPWLQQYFKEKGGLPGENGHPISTVEGQKLSMERLVTIDPNNICFLLKDYEFQGEDLLFGTIDTIDDINGPGAKFRNSILQGMEPAVSCRSLVPQQKNPDGTIDVTGSGRLICYDRVILPSHEEAFRDTKSEIKNIVKKNKLVESFESAISDLDFTNWVFQKADNVKFILDGLTPVMEGAIVDVDGIFSIPTDEGHLFIPVNNNRQIMNEIKSFMMR